MGKRERTKYYFLGLALKEHINQGIFYPSYILCKSLTTSKSRSGYRVTQVFDGRPSKNLPKVLVTEPFGHDDLLNFLSVYQTRDGFKGKHYHPEGALCWFECNKYGDPSGVVLFARKVPIKNLMFKFKGKKEFREGLFNKVKTLQEIFTDNIFEESYKNSCVKPRLYQGRSYNPTKRRRIKYGKSRT